MQALRAMREEMEKRKQVALTANAKKARAGGPTLPPRGAIPPNPTLGRVREKTPVEASQGVRDSVPPIPTKAMNRVQTEALLKGGVNVLSEPIPEGYRAISRNQKEEARQVVALCWKNLVCSFDFETNADQEEGVDILEDKIVGMSVSWEPYKAVYFPTGHDSYGANWDTQELLEIFRPLLESEAVLKIAFNLK